ncbi:hypothetical protein EIP86_004517 [Pleurotus ostreatoroseus]|nr:hypothetical protein EIP86_004517 [Pleurotus ostreatoroseus]
MALVAVPSHRIHSAFGAPSFASISGASPSTSHLQATFNAQPNVSYRSRAAPLSILAARTAAASAQGSSTPVVTRPRRPSFRSVTIPSAPVDTRRVPPSARTQAQDPFADSCGYVQPPPRAARTPIIPSQKTIILTYSSYAYPSVSTPRVQVVDTNRTSRLVASVLLNRMNGRPLRPRARAPMYAPGEEKVYVPSCLSKMVEVEC